MQHVIPDFNLLSLALEMTSESEPRRPSPDAATPFLGGDGYTEARSHTRAAVENKRLAGSRFEVENVPQGGLRFSFFDASDHLVCRSRLFSSLGQVADAVATFKRGIKPTDFIRLRSRAGSGFYFMVCGPTHSELATSTMFMNLMAREAAIATILRDAPTALVFNGDLLPS